jgi:hypothetical protein
MDESIKSSILVPITTSPDVWTTIYGCLLVDAIPATETVLSYHLIELFRTQAYLVLTSCLQLEVLLLHCSEQLQIELHLNFKLSRGGKRHGLHDTRMHKTPQFRLI